MSFKPARLTKFFGAAAAIIFVGGVHLEIAAGRDLRSTPPTDASDRTTTLIARNDVDRSGKTDRAALAQEAPDTTTVVINNSTLPLTTIAIRVLQTASDAGDVRTRLLDNQNVPLKMKKKMVACEGVVSTLTEVAKHLEPGRCVT